MTTLVVPSLEGDPWPSLGGQVARWIEANLVHGPGDLRGMPAKLDNEKRGLLYRMYEVYPRDHPQAGRRRFRRVAISLRKGSAKTEYAAWIAAAELHPDAPVRVKDWRGNHPVGGGVTDPYIPMVAYTEEQADDLAYAALRVTLDEGPLRDDFDIGLQRIMRKHGDGKAVALAGAPDARDGARTTFQHFDETHRFVSPRLHQAHQTMMANLPKRRLADPWSLETTTAPAPGEGSIAERTMEYARQVLEGAKSDSRLFFFHRQAGDHHDLTTREGIRAAVLEASGPIAEWSDIDGIVEQWDDPTADRAYLERVWLNRLVRASDRAFDALRWAELASEHEIAPGALVTLGFDGARTRDATALVACEVKTGLLQILALWERPENAPEDWEVPVAEVDAAVDAAFKRFRVWRMYADPPYWEQPVADWAGRYGDKTVIFWYTNRYRQMSLAVQAFDHAVSAAELSHTADARLTRHIGNAYRRLMAFRDDQDRPLWIIQKERPDSPFKIDAAMAAILAWEARRHAVTAGMAAVGPSVYESRGLLSV